jgi:hypothetical protein
MAAATPALCLRRASRVRSAAAEDKRMGLWVMQVLAAGFLAVLFLQSGLDKLIDRQGNLDWLEQHFANSPLAGMVAMMLSVVTAVEVGAGVFSALGAVVLSGGAILMLFFGQRVAKDYAGAAVLVSYFLLVLAALYLFDQ